MPSLVTFTDFLLATDEKVITPSREILNEAVKNTYIMRDANKGRDMGKVFRSGSKLTDRIMLEDNGSFMFYEPNQEFNPTIRQLLKKISVNWRFAVGNYGYNDEEIELNEGDTETQYKDLAKDYRQGCMTSIWNGMEDACWAYPSASGMEADAGKIAYSIPAFIDEIGTDFHWPGFTTVMGLDPANESRWRNKIRTYNPAAPNDATNGIVGAFDKMFLDVKFVAPDQASEYFESETMVKQKIITNLTGQVLYKQALRALNDRTVSPQDPAYNSPVYAGIPVKYISTLDDALLDQEAAVTGTPAAWAADEPRFYWLNFNYIFPVWHSKRYMKRTGPIHGGPRQPFSHVVYYNTYYNWFCRSRQRQGIVTPVGFA